MSKTSTFFYFLDTRESESDLFIEVNKFCNDDFTEFESVRHMLDSLKLEPSKESLEKILEYSRRTD